MQLIIVVCATGTTTGVGEHVSGAAVGKTMTTTPPDVGDCVGAGAALGAGLTVMFGTTLEFAFGEGTESARTGKYDTPPEQPGMRPESDIAMTTTAELHATWIT